MKKLDNKVKGIIAISTAVSAAVAVAIGVVIRRKQDEKDRPEKLG